MLSREDNLLPLSRKTGNCRKSCLEIYALCLDISNISRLKISNLTEDAKPSALLSVSQQSSDQMDLVCVLNLVLKCIDALSEIMFC